MKLFTPLKAGELLQHGSLVFANHSLIPGEVEQLRILFRDSETTYPGPIRNRTGNEIHVSHGEFDFTPDANVNGRSIYLILPAGSGHLHELTVEQMTDVSALMVTLHDYVRVNRGHIRNIEKALPMSDRDNDPTLRQRTFRYTVDFPAAAAALAA